MSHETVGGEIVEWNWWDRTGTGKVNGPVTSEGTRTITRTELFDNACEGDPICRIEQQDGNVVLGSISELRTT